MSVRYDDQFLLGRALLVKAPEEETDAETMVFLPAEARWFEYYSGEEQLESGYVRVDTEIDHIAVFVRGGTVIPRKIAAGASTVEQSKGALELLLVPNRRGNAWGFLYLDDGESYAYREERARTLMEFKFSSAEGLLTAHRA